VSTAGSASIIGLVAERDSNVHLFENRERVFLAIVEKFSSSFRSMRSSRQTTASANVIRASRVALCDTKASASVLTT